MNVLEKILGKLEERLNMVESIPVNEDDDFLDGEECYEDGRTQGRFKELLWCRDIIRSHMDEAKDINVPSNDGWIPVEKKLPEEKGWYQCTCSDKDIWNEGIVRDLYYYPEIKKFVDNIRYENNGLKNIEKYYWTKYVTAWQPLPEPYRQKEQKSAKNTQLHISGNR